MTAQNTSLHRILLVEDSFIIQTIHKAFLAENYHVDLASHGKEALEKLENAKYSAIIMDFQLPDKSGIEITADIRAKGGYFSYLPIIGLTSQKEAKEKALAAGMNDVLIKPIDKKALKQCVVDWIKKQSKFKF